MFSVTSELFKAFLMRGFMENDAGPYWHNDKYPFLTVKKKKRTKTKQKNMENKRGYCNILMVTAASFAVRQYDSHFQLAMWYPSSC